MGILAFIPRRRKRVWALTFVAAVASGVGCFSLLTTTQLGRELEYRSIDARFQHRGERQASRDVLILGIDNSTDEALHERFPYPRSYYARAIDRLAANGAKAIVFDIQFLEADPGGPAEDQQLIEAAQRAGNVVFATAPEGAMQVTETGKERSTVVTPLPFRGVHLAAYPDPLAASGAQVANAQQVRTSDEVNRYVNPLRTLKLEDGSSQKIPSVSLAALAVASGKSPFDYHGLPDRMEINYRGATGIASGDPGHKRFAYHNFSDVVNGADASFVRGKIVFVGATSPVLQDLHETPFAAKKEGDPEPTHLMPGVEIHAHALDTIRHRDWLVRQPDQQARITAALLVLVSVLALCLLPLPVGFLLSLLIDLGWGWYALSQFDAHGRVLQLVPVTGASLAALVLASLTVGSIALSERRRVTKLFSRYVAGDVVNELLVEADRLEVGGQRRVVTVLFSDIRSYTSLSENLDPAELVDQLNEYFEEMLDAIAFERGTFDKFIGDGLMAIFGAPLPQDDHAERACNAALDMIERLQWLNEERAERGLQPLRVGIGIHTGEAIVGNIGSPSFRVDYTAIGDTVNLASRLESSTKELGVQILVSKETAAAASGHHYASRGSITVKGREQAVDVFELLPDAEGPSMPGSHQDRDAADGEAA